MAVRGESWDTHDSDGRMGIQGEEGGGGKRNNSSFGLGLKLGFGWTHFHLFELSTITQPVDEWYCRACSDDADDADEVVGLL